VCDGECRATFAALKTDEFTNRRALYLDEKQSNCCCEQHSVSEFSQGPVENHEKIIRLLVAPQHAKNGRPKASALTDAERNGLSLFREALVTDNHIRSVAMRLVARARENQINSRKKCEVGLFGVLYIECSVIRAFKRDAESERCYCVYDTAQADNPSHSEAFQCVASIDEAVQEDRRRQLFTIVQSTFVSVIEFRNGLLKDLAPASFGIVHPHQ
jgi:hypothetical protein